MIRVALILVALFGVEAWLLCAAGGVEPGAVARELLGFVR